MDTKATNPVTAFKEDRVNKTAVIGAEDVVVEPILILNINVGHTECVPIWTNISGPYNIATKNTQYGVTICWLVKETAPDKSGRYFLVKLM